MNVKNCGWDWDGKVWYWRLHDLATPYYLPKVKGRTLQWDLTKDDPVFNTVAIDDESLHRIVETFGLGKEATLRQVVFEQHSYAGVRSNQSKKAAFEKYNDMYGSNHDGLQIFSGGPDLNKLFSDYPEIMPGANPTIRLDAIISMKFHGDLDMLRERVLLNRQKKGPYSSGNYVGKMVGKSLGKGDDRKRNRTKEERKLAKDAYAKKEKYDSGRIVILKGKQKSYDSMTSIKHNNGEITALTSLIDRQRTVPCKESCCQQSEGEERKKYKKKRAPKWFLIEFEKSWDLKRGVVNGSKYKTCRAEAWRNDRRHPSNIDDNSNEDDDKKESVNKYIEEGSNSIHTMNGMDEISSQESEEDEDEEESEKEDMETAVWQSKNEDFKR